MHQGRVEHHTAVPAAVAAVTDDRRPRLTPIPVDDWVLRGHGGLLADLQRQGEALGTLPPAAVAELLALVERRLAGPAWTPVSERLPEPGTVVLGWHRCEGHRVLEYAPEADGRCWFDRACESVDAAEILAWRPLPPAPSPDDRS